MKSSQTPLTTDSNSLDSEKLEKAHKLIYGTVEIIQEHGWRVLSPDGVEMMKSLLLEKLSSPETPEDIKDICRKYHVYLVKGMNLSGST